MTWLNSLTPMATACRWPRQTRHAVPAADAQPDDDLIHDHGANTAGHKLAKLRQSSLAAVFAAEHKGAVGPVGKQNADDIIQHIANAGCKVRAQHSLEHGKQHQVQQRGKPAKNR